MDSLFDDPAFIAALDRLDLPSVDPRPVEHGHRRTLIEWATAEGLILDPPDSPFVPVAASGALQTLSAATFVGLAGVGAAVAGFVFHEQVARILAAL